jgi:sugar/nucleoside kinase (ribokinase family)
MAPRAIVAGHLCLDLTPQFLSDHMPEPGQLAIVGPATLSTGGAVSNTGLDLLRLGVATELCGKVGDDYFGSAVRGIIERHTPGSSRGILVSPHEATSYTLVLSPAGRDRAFVHCPGANDSFGPDDIPQALLEQADLLHYGYPSVMKRMYSNGGRALVELLTRARQAGLTTSLDLAYVDPDSEGAQADWPAILRAALPLVDSFVPSVEEVRAIWDQTSSERAQGLPDALPRLAQTALAAGARIVMIKAGTNGVYLRTGSAPCRGRGAPRAWAAWQQRELWSPAFAPERVVTTTGAGDAAVACFLAAMLRGESPELAVSMACAAGACCCERADATSGVRTWDETLARLRAGWRQLPLDLSPHGWQWDEEARLWHRGQ